MKFCALIIELYASQKYFAINSQPIPKIAKSCSKHLKKSKSIKKRQSKICKKTILFSVCMVESKKKKKNAQIFSKIRGWNAKNKIRETSVFPQMFVKYKLTKVIDKGEKKKNPIAWNL